MPWRVIAHGDEVWQVDAVVDRRPHAPSRQLEATSKSSLLLSHLLAERLA